jgi:hypothetical protein
VLSLLLCLKLPCGAGIFSQAEVVGSTFSRTHGTLPTRGSLGGDGGLPCLVAWRRLLGVAL